MLELEILGSNATAPTKEGPASCYLLHTETGLVLVDAGPGSLLAYCSRYELEQLRGIVVTHMHADHSLDLMAWAYRWTFPEVLPRVPLFLPEGEAERVAAFDAVFGIPTLPTMNQPITQSFDITAMPRDGRTVHEVDGVAFRSYAAHHSVPSAALRFESPDGRVVAFSSDTGYCAPVAEAAREADLFVCEATYLEADERSLHGHGHLTARMAGELAAEARARHLVLTHFASPADWDEGRRHAEGAFGGSVSVAVPGSRF
ncbi:MBL fold metallo-hydrolase [Nocardiopsis sp. L17-MgMaSL7]|uniref:MBL fold metallo-hydrolase n=1 Tax=Nocardiopsis sp. L17-MgMaSL7 TaxID=1938893 RepID=UPI000D70EAC3|nr:MBL fold metallo-hydrolase [Nocardiopsis sp. L17-MgMaSL7]PWV55269.1 ribonuclease BN (tRNA processing enzyme) [Nocardiopsis sp. L17-MgMaSL7]